MIMVTYNRTIARFPLLLCSTYPPLPRGSRLGEPRPPNFTIKHATRGRGISPELIPSYQVSTKS
jgi:hypothetical protein